MLKNIKQIKKCWHLLAVLLIFTSCAHLNNTGSTKNEFRNSVVRISTTTQKPYYYSPWIWHPPHKKNGQGIVVGKDLVLTIASVVKNAKLIEMTMGAEPLPTPMEVVALDLNANLALLRGKLPKTAKPVSIPSISPFNRSEALNLYWKTGNGMVIEGSAQLDRVETKYNFDSFQGISMLKSVKSTHPNIGHGIPVFDSDNQFFGLALRGGGEYSFYIISCDTINRTLDISKGTKKTATAVAGFSAEALTQVYYREKLGLTKNNGGCLISKVFGQGSGYKQLKEGDVLLSVCGKKLDAWGKYKSVEHGTRSYTHLFSEHYLSDKFYVTIVRDKKEQVINLDLSDIDDLQWLIKENPDNKKSQYIIRGGFVFIPLEKTYLKEWGQNFVNKAPMQLVSVFDDNRYKIKTPDKKEFIVLSRVLSHPTNIGIQNLNNQIIEEVNGKPVKSLKELAGILNDTKNDVLKLKLYPGNTPLWLSKKVMKSADQDILTHYGINSLEDLTE